MMKKSLIALAVMAASGAAFAATSNVDVSGKVAVSINSYDKNTSNVDMDGPRVENNNSSITISVKEDLGGGMTAGFSGTYGLNPSANDTTFAGQNQILTLGTSAGTVLVGTFDNPVKVLGRGYELFGDNVGDFRAILNRGNSDARSENVVAYLSPSFSGFSGAIATFNATSDENMGSGQGRNWVLKAQYANGPLSLGVAHQKADNSASTDEKVLRAAAGYKFGDTKLNAMYQTVDNAGGISTVDSSGYVLGVAHNMGAITLKAQYTNYNDKATANLDAKMWAVGADYALSKRTTLSVNYASLDNATNGLEAIDGWTGADTQGTLTAGQDPSVFGVSMKHTF